MTLRLRHTTRPLGRMAAGVLGLLLVVACEAESAGPAGGGDALSPGGTDVVDLRRDLSAWLGADGAVADTGPGEGYVPPEATAAQGKALERVNWYRWRVGLPHIDMNQAINGVAQAHCDCYVEHEDEWDWSPHVEDPSWSPPCMGEGLGDRMTAGGITGFGASEIIAFTATPYAAVDGWMATIYHRLPIVDPTTLECGYGEHTTAPRINTMNFTHAMAAPDPAVVVMYPNPGSTDVSHDWDGAEEPQPPVPPDGYPSGPIVTLTLGKGPFVCTAHSIRDAEGTELPHQYLDATNDEHMGGSNTVCLYPNRPLARGATYTVRFDIETSEGTTPHEWSFTTRP